MASAAAFANAETLASEFVAYLSDQFDHPDDNGSPKRVRQMHALSLRFGAKLQKGCSAQVKEQAAGIMQKFGARALGDFAKLHFRTAYEVVSAEGKLDELPLPEPKARFGFGEE